MPLLPISAVIPTLNRPERTRRTVAGLLAQEHCPAEIIIIDASDTLLTVPSWEHLLTARDVSEAPVLRILPADRRGAAAQRNQGVALATQPALLFLDDDVDLAPGCVASLWHALRGNPRLGGCGALGVNQPYHPPGRTLRRLLRVLGCPSTGSLAGRCCGPALNFLPAPAVQTQAETGAVDWLNLGCTLYRGAALPQPPLLDFFAGYSLMEDAALALQVGRRWQLSVPPGARYFHDYQEADYKSRLIPREKMEVMNRWFVMTRILGRDTWIWQVRLFLYQFGMLLLLLRTTRGWGRFPLALAGKLAGLVAILRHGAQWRGYPDTPSL